MPTVNLTRDAATGHLVGVTPKDSRAYERFLARFKSMTPRDSITFSWKQPRSGAFHKRHFAMLGRLFDAQEQFDNDDQFRKWLEIGAGYVDFVPGPKGRMVAMPRSIAYDALDQVEFEPIHDAVFAFARSEHARRFLWPHLGDQQSWEMVESVMGEFM